MAKMSDAQRVGKVLGDLDRVSVGADDVEMHSITQSRNRIASAQRSGNRTLLNAELVTARGIIRSRDNDIKAGRRSKTTGGSGG